MFERDEPWQRVALTPVSEALRARFEDEMGPQLAETVAGTLTPVAYHRSESWVALWEGPDGEGAYAWIDSEGSPLELFARTHEEATSLVALGAGALYDVLSAAIQTVDGEYATMGWSEEGWARRLAEIDARVLGAVDRAQWRSEGVSIPDGPTQVVIATLRTQRLRVARREVE
jgi:hypothetical protein